MNFKILLTLLTAAAVLKLAATVTVPEKITLNCGNITILLERSKAYTINRIDYCKRQLGVSSPGAQYGTVCNFTDLNGPIGSGHTETGYREIVNSLEITIDGKRADLKKSAVFSGKTVKIEKISAIRSFTIKTVITLQADRMYEYVSMTAKEDEKLNHIYHFMHPWKVDFSEMLFISGDGKGGTYSFSGDNRFPIYRPANTVAIYNPLSGDAVLTVLDRKKCRGSKNILRVFWDRKHYRKDYAAADFYHTVFPKGHTAEYAAVTAFFNSKDPSKWLDDAANLIKSVNSQ